MLFVIALKAKILFLEDFLKVTVVKIESMKSNPFKEYSKDPKVR